MQPYDFAKETAFAMPKRKTSASQAFGRRMAELRQTAGYTQRSLAAELGISQRMVAYYESETQHPPAHLLPALASALGITVDQLLGVAPMSKRKTPKNARLMRQLAQVEKLPPRARTAVLEHIEALVAKHRHSGE